LASPPSSSGALCSSTLQTWLSCATSWVSKRIATGLQEACSWRLG
jgi:hypothetical protein